MKKNRITVREGLLLVFIVLTGFVLRAWKVSEIGLSEFDEGVYAMNALGLSTLEPPRFYLERMAPPAYYGFVGLTYKILGGPSDSASIWINICIGTFTILGAWWIGRMFFSNSAGIIAAALVSWSEYHILISRTAMTDAAFGLFFMISIAFALMAFERNRLPIAALAGLAIGLTWNTKYHGWLVAIIAGCAIAGCALDSCKEEVPRMRMLFLWLVMAVTAAICYLPWFLFLQSKPGGYSFVIDTQSSFLGLHWIHNIKSYVGIASFLEGPVSCASIPGAFLVSYLVQPSASLRSWNFILTLAALAISSLVVGSAGTIAFLAVLALVKMIRHRSLVVWILISWVTILFFLTPFYQPYARLALPLFLGSCVLAGYEFLFLWKETNAETDRSVWQPLLIAAIALVVFAASMKIYDPSNTWGKTRGLAETANAVTKWVPAGTPVYVIAEPPLAFYLQQQDRPSFSRVRDFEELLSLPSPVYFITGIYTKRAFKLRDGFEKIRNKVELIDTFQFMPNDLRLLDDFEPSKAKKFRSQPDKTYELNLYRMVHLTNPRK